MAVRRLVWFIPALLRADQSIGELHLSKMDSIVRMTAKPHHLSAIKHLEQLSRRREKEGDDAKDPEPKAVVALAQPGAANGTSREDSPPLTVVLLLT